MTADDALDALAERFGIVGKFRDLEKVERPTSKETKLALLRANGLALDSEAAIIETLKAHQAKSAARSMPVEIIHESEAELCLEIPAGWDWRIVLEDGGGVFTEGRSDGRATLPAMPSGLHHLIAGGGKTEERVLLIIAPRQCPSIAEVAGVDSIWGINAALYGLHAQQSPGLGSFADLAVAAEACAAHGADFLGINPVHAIG